MRSRLARVNRLHGYQNALTLPPDVLNYMRVLHLSAAVIKKVVGTADAPQDARQHVISKSLNDVRWDALVCAAR